MFCHSKPKNVEEETYEYLLGPKTSAIPESDNVIYKDAALCSVWALENGKEFPSRKEDAQLYIPFKTFPSVIFRQSYRQWKAGMDMAFRLSDIKKRKIIYIQPLGDFPSFLHEFKLGECNGFIEFLRYVSEIFFLGFEVKLLPPLHFEDAGWEITSRIQKKTQQKQYRVTDIHKHLKKYLPRDGYCAVGITWTDLYPREGVNFCLGEANASFSSAALCFGRFEPKKFVEDQPPPPPLVQVDGPLIWRMIKVIVHETCHILGLAHCFFFECLMNESKSLDEAASQPLFLCPVCLRKVQKMAKFNIKDRYIKLRELLHLIEQHYQDRHFNDSIEWLNSIISRLEYSSEL